MKTNLLPLLLLAIPLYACAGAPPIDTSSIEIRDPWVRTAPSAEAGRMNGTLFMAIKNRGNSADALLKIESDSAQMAQIHLTEVDANGAASMKEVQAVEIPAGGSVEFKPGGYHVMLMDLAGDTREGSNVTFTLIFRNAGEVIIQAPVKTP